MWRGSPCDLSPQKTSTSAEVTSSRLGTQQRTQPEMQNTRPRKEVALSLLRHERGISRGFKHKSSTREPQGS